ncbi:hypothetical protein Rsub_10786 [Raphidocelis subcapitata]|uniref:F-box domain-containing protein n=1 Tax=Raphidocelis subcapitata TaxID=307507 RepID=A0A2V0PEV7_9CHLO|nr:hypothetical protein Rsub_10786 [Raphidocelis subcapitata]|eukprot:GBF98391.1 hypothetical protein Rsub_10786 [Raphidocelis subcapitata]
MGKILQDADARSIAAARLACRGWRRAAAGAVADLRRVPASALAPALAAFPRAVRATVGARACRDGDGGAAASPGSRSQGRSGGGARRKPGRKPGRAGRPSATPSPPPPPIAPSGSLQACLQAAAPLAARLVTLHLRGPGVDAGALARALATTLPPPPPPQPFGGRAFASLARLELFAVAVSRDDLRTLAGSAPQLTSLVIERWWMPRDEGIFRCFPPASAQRWPGLKALELRGPGALQAVPFEALAAGLERLTVDGLGAQALRFDHASTSLRTLELRCCWSLAALDLSPLPALSRLGLHDLPRLRALWRAAPDEYWAPLEQLRKLPGLEELVITGRHFDARVPPAVSTLTQLTRLEVGLRWQAGAREGPNADSEPLWPRRGANARPCPIAGCASLRELVLRDRGPRLELGDADGLLTLTCLTSLDLGGVANPVLLGDWLLRMPALRRLVVPPGVPGLEERRRPAASGARQVAGAAAQAGAGAPQGEVATAPAASGHGSLLSNWASALLDALHVLRSLLLK